jgi:hypothetical protein
MRVSTLPEQMFERRVSNMCSKKSTLTHAEDPCRTIRGFEGTSQVLNKVFRAMRSEGVSPANIAGDLHLDPNDLSDLVFGLVVTSISGNGERAGHRPHRPQLNLVR